MPAGILAASNSCQNWAFWSSENKEPHPSLDEGLKLTMFNFRLALTEYGPNTEFFVTMSLSISTVASMAALGLESMRPVPGSRDASFIHQGVPEKIFTLLSPSILGLY